MHTDKLLEPSDGRISTPHLIPLNTQNCLLFPVFSLLLSLPQSSLSPSFSSWIFSFFPFILSVSSFMQAITSDSNFMQASCSLQFKLSMSFYRNTLTFRYSLLSFSFSFSFTVAYTGFWNLQHEEREKSKAMTRGTFFGFLVILPLPFFAPFCLVATAKCRIAYQVSNICHSLIGGFQLLI